jgi:hypothetical protein
MTHAIHLLTVHWILVVLLLINNELALIQMLQRIHVGCY